MIAPQELMELKARILKGAGAAGKIASSTEPLVYEDEEEFARVYTALTSLHGDVVRVLAELDVLRGMFAERLSNFFMEGMANGLADGRGDVAAVPDKEGQGGGESERQDAAGVGSGVPKGRAARKRAAGSKPRRNRKGDGGAAEPVGSADGTQSMDRSSPA